MDQFICFITIPHTKNYFTHDTMETGDVVSLCCAVDNEVDVSNRTGLLPIGMTLNTVMVGGKVSVLIKGTFLYKFDESLELPIKQPIYVDLKNSKLSWKKLGPKVGYLLEPQNKNGECHIKVNFME